MRITIFLFHFDMFIVFGSPVLLALFVLVVKYLLFNSDNPLNKKTRLSLGFNGKYFTAPKGCYLVTCCFASF